MNAAKALLTAKGIRFNPYHGVKRHNMRGASSRISLSNEGVEINKDGVLPSLSTYFAESEPSRKHSLQELLFNMPFVHRTYCLTYTSQVEMFVPLTKCGYFFDRKTKEVTLRAELSRDGSPKRLMKRLPSTFRPDPDRGERTICSAASISWARPTRPSHSEETALLTLHRQLRGDLHYINGAQTLWYLKMNTNGPARLCRQPPTIVLAAMHRLSEICRYRPLELSSYLSGQKNWLLSEFIQLSPIQFIDEIASELTGHQFLVPNVRTPT